MNGDARHHGVPQGTLPGSRRIYLIRHGETTWSAEGRHTGGTDIPLTERGESDATRIGERLRSVHFAAVLTSPLLRARRTCELAALEPSPVIDSDLREWDYGRWEGLRTAEIRQQQPNWNLFVDGCPGGETVDEIGARADRVIARIGQTDGNVAIFSHGHFLRVLTARWVGLAALEGRRFMLKAAALSILGFEHDNLDEPAVVLWNDDGRIVR